MLGSNLDSVATSTFACTAGLTASGPCVPGVVAIDIARVSVANALRLRRCASSTSELSSGDDRPSSGLHSTSALVRTGGPVVPARLYAVDRAVELVAGLVLFGSGAYLAAVSVSSHDRLAAVLRTSGAGGTASRKPGPVGKLAVNLANVRVAARRGLLSPAPFTTILGSSNNRPRLDLGATTALLGAATIPGPAGELAINGARLIVAHTILSERAFVTTVLGSSVNLESTGLLTSAARLGASSPGVPGVLAVDGARVSVAVLLHRPCVTDLATMSRPGKKLSPAFLDAASTLLRALKPAAPRAQDAVNRTGLRVTVPHTRVQTTRDTTVGCWGDDGLGSTLGSSTARQRALAPTCPARKYAIDGACLGLAGGRERKNATYNTSVGDILDDGA
jgi:hypothetical protein